MIGVKCDEQFSSNESEIPISGDCQSQGSLPGLSGAKQEGFLRASPRPPFRILAWRMVGSIFTDFANVRPVSAFVGEPASLPDPPPDDATWRACAPEWRLWPGACPPQSRSRGHPRRALGRWPVPAKPRNTRAGGSPTGPRADTYIYMYIDSAKPKGAPSGTITSAEFNRACAPKAEVFLQFKSASSQPWTARRSRGSDYSDDATL
jgi:hypothetical protein